MSSDRTEQPTGKRLEDARKKGQVARTREAGQAASLIAAVLVLGWMGERFVTPLLAAISNGITRAGHAATTPLDAGEVTRLAVHGLATVGMVAGPLAGAAVVAVVALHTAQGGWNVATQALEVKWERLSPAQGLKRLAPSTGGIELLRAAIAVAAIAALGWRWLAPLIDGGESLAGGGPVRAAGVVWDSAAGFMRQTALALLLLAGADYLVQRQRLMKSLRMTRQEVKDEARLTQGNPEIKSRVRRIQRDLVRRRMLSATRRATVVITNPTHYAIALEYRRASMAAPVVVAKGRGPLAQRIKAIAREHGVPTVENVSLARALYASADVGDVIPGALFEAVAEVLAYLIRIKQLALS